MATTLLSFSEWLNGYADHADTDTVGGDRRGADGNHFILDGLTYEVWSTTRVGRMRDFARHLKDGGSYAHRLTADGGVGIDFDGRIDHFYVYRPDAESTGTSRHRSSDRPWWTCTCGEPNPPAMSACGHCETAR
jgi:hypothetical protein